MQISELRRQTSDALKAFAWDQWAQLGFMATTDRRDRIAADPEALILLTLEVGRDEPRLFDELLDWLVVNERLVSVQRLRNLAVDLDDERLVEAGLAWVGVRRPRSRLVRAAIAGRGVDAHAGTPLFRTSRQSIPRPDEVFLRHGFLRGQVQPRRHSQPPNVHRPIAFAFRIRQMLGVGARAETVRALLTTDARRLPAQVIAESAGYSKRNVHEALVGLHAAGVIDAVTVANEQRYGIARDRWAPLLGLAPDDLPGYRDWPQLLLAMRRLLRWLHDPVHKEQSDYLRASDARELLRDVGPLLRFAGVAISDRDAPGIEYWPAFVDTVIEATRSL